MNLIFAVTAACLYAATAAGDSCSDEVGSLLQVTSQAEASSQEGKDTISVCYKNKGTYSVKKFDVKVKEGEDNAGKFTYPDNVNKNKIGCLQEPIKRKDTSTGMKVKIEIDILLGDKKDTQTSLNAEESNQFVSTISTCDEKSPCPALCYFSEGSTVNNNGVHENFGKVWHDGARYFQCRESSGGWPGN
eukprot:TRINITY_DN31330_c0_g1_i1.p1 TRINITY_DN31330_c0_g1~~TRINITY_DN31330_c0_g1_i1.p1  ORF type:complete len:189 (+),score=33.65 TRINITY_DN31330_c0_g1_i1:60-626(+)